MAANQPLASLDLAGANLSGANLTGADLYCAIGDGFRIITLQSVYHINYTSTHIQIGCECHTIEEWAAFSDEDIYRMDENRALEFWYRYKTWLFDTIALHPAVI